MVCFVYRPKVRGRKSRLYSGRYRFDDMARPVTVPLRTPDELVARKRLNDLVVNLQRQKEGMAPAAAMREAAGKDWAEVVTAYAADLRAQARRPQHVKDTSRRLLRMGRECRWRTISEATAASFTTWRAAVIMSAKTRKEYQVSLNAFFRWLLATDRYDRNPFAKVRMPETRGKAVRRRRAFTEAEVSRLLDVAEHRRLPYLFLFYTGTRYREAWGLLWGDVHFTGPNGPYVLIQAERTKDREARAIPLHPALYLELFAHAANRGRRDTDEARVFRHIFPTQKRASGEGSLAVDLRAAGIAKKDEAGRVIDFQSFRKTWQTLGVNAGVTLRSAQAILGHSTPELTAGAYTDVAGLELAREMAKMPWMGSQRPQHSTLQTLLSVDGGPYWTRTRQSRIDKGLKGEGETLASADSVLAWATLAVIAQIYWRLLPANQQALCLLARALERGGDR